MVKVSNIVIGLKKTCLGVLDRGEREKDNETGLKEGGVIEILTTVLHSRCSLLRFCILLTKKWRVCNLYLIMQTIFLLIDLSCIQ